MSNNKIFLHRHQTDFHQTLRVVTYSLEDDKEVEIISEDREVTSMNELNTLLEEVKLYNSENEGKFIQKIINI